MNRQGRAVAPCSLAVLALALCPVPAAGAESGFLAGQEWVGRYRCAQGTTALTLKIVGAADPSAPLRAIFSFGGQGQPEGAYYVAGDTRKSQGVVELSPTSWIDRPPGYIAVGLSGRVSADGRNFAGRITHPSCGQFALTLNTSEALSETARHALSQPKAERRPPEPVTARAETDPLQAAAEAGDPVAQRKLGERYAFGREVAQEDMQAAKWFRLAAEQGEMEAQYKLAVMYDQGYGAARDPQQALRWFSAAAEQGHTGAQNNLGVLYEHGRGVSQDPKKAAIWYRKAADSGLPAAQYNLGALYEGGRGVAQDRPLALKYYRMAANQGYEAANNKVAAMTAVTATKDSPRRRSGTEPTEAELCQALRDKYRAISENMRQVNEACKSGAARNDPLLAIQCLGQWGATGGTGRATVQVTRCEKVACEKASGQPGYLCDFVAGLDAQGLTLPPSYAGMLRQGDLGKGRFVETGDGWLFIPTNGN